MVSRHTQASLPFHVAVTYLPAVIYSVSVLWVRIIADVQTNDNAKNLSNENLQEVFLD